MENLNGKIAVVLGGTGGVGEGIVKALLEGGAKVVVPSRNQLNLDRLTEYVAGSNPENLIPHPGSVDTEENALQFGRFLHQNFKHIDLAVASIGSWHQGHPVYAYPVNDWNRILNDNLTAHFLAVKTLVPMLDPRNSCYFHINGFGADEPHPYAGPVAMCAAAQKSLIQTLAKEVDKTGIKIYELILGPIKTRDRLQHGHGRDDWYFPEDIGTFIRHETQIGFQEKVVHYFLKK
jgi:NAD(P)-dependent dehydrogenase (short-subunit alcohol dehydrogenase family)